jgi:hypothetical protein
MDYSDIDEKSWSFLTELYERTKAEPSVQVSMYDIGTALGFDRDDAKRVAEELIGWELVEIRTLSGGIGISENGIAEIQRVVGGPTASQDPEFKLGDAQIIDEDARQGVEQITLDLKKLASSLGLEFENLAEFVADLKTIDAQLDSSRPKTAILRECFRSIKDVAERAGANDSVAQIKALIE